MIIIIILSSLATSNEVDAHGLLFTASPLELNSKRIYNLQYMAYSVEKTLPVAWLGEKLSPTIVPQLGLEPSTSHTA